MTKSLKILQPSRIWTEEQIAILCARYPNEPSAMLVDAIGRSLKSIYNMAKKLGLKKSAEFLRSDYSGRIKRGRSDPRMVAHQFKKGHTTWNEGMRIPGWAPGRMAEGQFVKGGSPHNTMPIGSYRLSKDGALQRKIGNAHGSNSKRWRGVHELVWIEANGPVPDGHICVFKRGMKTSVLEEITVDKVECITLAENMRRNTIHRYPKEIADVMRLTGIVNRRINKMEKQNEQ